MLKSILGVKVNLVNRSEALEMIEKFVEERSFKCRLVATAYSEFFVEAKRDDSFMKVLNGADLVTPDGVSVLAAAKYLDLTKNNKGVISKIVCGLQVGGEVLSGSLGETVTGVFLFEELAAMAEKNDWKLFLLGGWNNVASRSTEILLKRFPSLRVEYDAGEQWVGADEQNNQRVIAKINKFKPDILFVSYNPVKQEKWVAKHQKNLKVGVAIGVGGTFDEFVGDKQLAPKWMERMGLKWLWRLIIEPSRWKRIWKAVVVFPWLVFRESL